jgi:hypothetical protein
VGPLTSKPDEAAVERSRVRSIVEAVHEHWWERLRQGDPKTVAEALACLAEDRSWEAELARLVEEGPG